MNAFLGINPIWITLGPIAVINAVLFISYCAYRFWVRRRISREYEGAKDHRSGLLSDATLDWWIWTTEPIVRFFVKLKVGPNIITTIGFLFALVAAYLFSRGWFGYAGWVMIFGASFDMFDGRVARITGKTTRSGAYYDSVMDRFGEGACLLGLAIHFRHSWLLPVVVAALVGSFLVSYTRARAGCDGIECAVGRMQRPERIVLLGVASIFDPLVRATLSRWWALPPPLLVIIALVAIAVLTIGTSIYRMIYAMNAMDTADERGRESIPQIITRLSTPEGREAFWDRARYGYDRRRALLSNVVLFIAGGMRPDIVRHLLARGDLPNMARHMVERGGIWEAAGSFPSTEGPALAPFVTGCFPGTCDLPGVQWFDRTVPASRVITTTRFRDYQGWGAYAMDFDLSKSVRTIFEYSRQAVNIFGMLNRGCGLVRDPAFFRMRRKHFRAGPSEETDAALEASFNWFSRAIRRETDFVLYCLPPLSSAKLEEDRVFLEEYKMLDEVVGQAAGLLQERGMYEETALMFSSDYSLGRQVGSFDLDRFVAGRYKTCPVGHWMREWQEAEVIALPSGTSMYHVYVRGKAGWAQPCFLEETEQRGLVDNLLQQEGIDIVAGRNAGGGIDVVSRRGRARIQEDARGHITYHVKGNDPFGFSGLSPEMDASESLQATWNSEYPDGIVQLLQIFRSRRTGDLVVSARDGVSLSPQEDELTHGSLSRTHLLVPFLSSVPMAVPRIRTVDVFVAVLNLLGIQPTHNIDAITPEHIVRVSEAASAT